MQKRFARLCICANIREVAQWNASGRGNAALPGEFSHRRMRNIIACGDQSSPGGSRNLANLSRAKDSVPELINHIKGLRIFFFVIILARF